MGFYEQAEEKLRKEFHTVTGARASAMRAAVRDALLEFARQEDEFAQAIVQGGSFPKCMEAVAKNVGASISDLEAYGRAVAFYFPGSKVRFEMHIDLIGDAGKDLSTPLRSAHDDRVDTKSGAGLVIDLSSFL